MDDGYLGDLPLWSDEKARAVLIAACKRHKVPVDVLDELVSVQRERQHQERAHGVYARFEEVLGRIE